MSPPPSSLSLRISSLALSETIRAGAHSPPRSRLERSGEDDLRRRVQRVRDALSLDGLLRPVRGKHPVRLRSQEDRVDAGEELTLIVDERAAGGISGRRLLHEVEPAVGACGETVERDEFLDDDLAHALLD
jgi:hypothetical protein